MTFEDPAAQRAARRSGALAGIGLLWVTLLASLGLLWLALGAVVATVVGSLAVLVAAWRPHLDLRALGAWTGRRVAGAGAAIGRATRPAIAGARAADRTSLAWLRRADAALGVQARSAWAALRRADTAAGVHTKAASAASGRAAAAAGARAKAASTASGGAAAAAWRRARTRRPHLPREALLAELRAVKTSVSARAGALELPGRRPTRAAGHKLAHESVVARREGRIGEAVSLAREAVTAFQAADDRRGEALALNTLALALAQDRRYAEAVDALDGALTLLGELGDRHREGTVLVNLGMLHRQAGGVESARFCWRKALERLDPASPESHETERLLRAS